MTFKHKLSKRLALMYGAGVLSLAGLGCELPAPTATDPANTSLPPRIGQLILFPGTIALRTDQTADFVVVGLTSGGDTVTISLSWSASGGSITGTSASGGKQIGHYRAPGQAGSHRVVVKDTSGLADTADVAVTTVPVARVDVTPQTASVSVGGAVQLTATPRDSAGNPLSGRAVAWASSAPGVSAVDGNGRVTGVAAGSATITATSESKSGTSAITVTNVPVASVTVSPVSASVPVGQTTQLTATVKDANGITLNGRPVTWASSSSLVATVNGSGLVTGVAAGAATITATSEGKSGTAAITVTAPVTNPGTVTDLAVAGVTESSVTLSFTEVNDGTGLPASYEVRYALTPIAWGAASGVVGGTCATPVAGSAIGTRRTCTVLGLSPATRYDVQLVAFRGTLDVDALFGNLSNVASVTTGGSPAPVASVEVTPASATISVGGVQQLTATPRDANGTPLSGRVVTWSSSNTLVAPVSTIGLVTGVSAGAATITATSEGQSGTSTVTVTVALPPPPGAGVVFESNWTTALGNTRSAVTDGDRWDQLADFGGGRILSVTSGGPPGYANALRVTQEGGTGGAAYVQRNDFVAPATDFYVRYYMKNDDVNNGGYDHIVAAWFAPVPPVSLFYMQKSATGGTWRVMMGSYGYGCTPYPIYNWESPAESRLANGQWYRFEYYIHYTAANRMQFHPRVYDAAGNLILSDADFRQLDYGSATWNGRSDWTLASYYAAGYDMCMDPLKMIDFGMGNNGQAGAVNTGQYWYYAAVQIRTDRWPGP